mmetsp:Transcript_56610/g.120194  ORF Transcript_56610/g.120194 Transcript_56610/m.120194 type:complete len:252 (-) Transcript_56610:581-1336(-)
MAESTVTMLRCFLCTPPAAVPPPMGRSLFSVGCSWEGSTRRAAWRGGVCAGCRRASSTGVGWRLSTGEAGMTTIRPPATALLLLLWLKLLVRLSFGGVSADSVGWTTDDSSDSGCTSDEGCAVILSDSAISDNSLFFNRRPPSAVGDVANASGSATSAVGRRTSSASEPREETSSPNGWKWAGVAASLDPPFELALPLLLWLLPLQLLPLYTFFRYPLSLLLRLRLLDTSTTPNMPPAPPSAAVALFANNA